MQVMVHLGLNKCASTYVQHALNAARPGLALRGTWYPEQDGPPCQYGLSRAYGFGPDEPGIEPQTLEHLLTDARQNGCDRLILSSEYFSLYRPRAASGLMIALDSAGCAPRFVLFSRDPIDWIHSLFNQYVRTVQNGRLLANIDAFVDQILKNGAVDIAARHRLWSGLAGDRLEHYRLAQGTGTQAVLAPFSAFAGTRIPAPPAAESNASVGTDALWRIGQLRARPRTKAEDRELQRLLSGAPAPGPAPKDYATISPERLARLQNKVIDPYRDLPVDRVLGAQSLAA